MTLNEKMTLLEETFDLEEGTLEEDMLLEDIEEYDSMAKLALIVMFDEEFERSIDGETIKGFRTVGDIVAIME